MLCIPSFFFSSSGEIRIVLSGRAVVGETYFADHEKSDALGIAQQSRQVFKRGSPHGVTEEREDRDRSSQNSSGAAPVTGWQTASALAKA